MVLNACLNLFKVSTGFLNKLPFANENCDAVIKFLECVKGPKIVFETYVSPFGTKNKCLYSIFFARSSVINLSLNFKASA